MSLARRHSYIRQTTDAAWGIGQLKAGAFGANQMNKLAILNLIIWDDSINGNADGDGNDLCESDEDQDLLL